MKYRLLLSCFLGLLLGLPALAQSDQPIDVFGGYSYSSDFDTGLNGWMFSGNYNLSESWLGLEGDISGHYGSNNIAISGLPVPIPQASIKAHMHNFDFGPRVTFRPSSSDEKFDVFGHLLFGASHVSVTANGISDSDTSFSWVLGGGGDYNFNEHWAARAQLDLLRTNFFSTGESHPRFSLGVVYRFGSY